MPQVEGQAVVLSSDGSDVLRDAAVGARRAKERAEVTAVRRGRVNTREARIANLRPATERACFKTAVGDEVTRNGGTKAGAGIVYGAVAERRPWFKLVLWQCERRETKSKQNTTESDVFLHDWNPHLYEPTRKK